MESGNVTTGKAAADAGATRAPESSSTCVSSMRSRTLSCATMIAPALASASLPPLWSGCQCVSTTKRTGDLAMRPTASSNWGASAAVPSSTRTVAVGPVQTATLPALPERT